MTTTTRESMTETTGCLRKMLAVATSPVTYALPLDDIEIPLNPFIGKRINLRFCNKIHCVHCHRVTPKSYQQGYCYPCMMRLAECDLCIVRPERCHADAGTCRDDDWAHAHCMVPHIVYLANSSGLKVGITRETQVPTRWLDQGARQALPLFRVSNRLQSGMVEVTLKEFVSDRTNWRKLLKQDAELCDMRQEAEKLLTTAKAPLEKMLARFKTGHIERLTDAEAREFNFPVQQYPEKISSLSFDKTPEISGVLWGIKGQYLILDSGVLNCRKFAGYQIAFSSNHDA